MARPKVIETEALVAAARSAFLEQGVGVGTAEIARRAGISEGTLFSRFATKEELFEEAIGLRRYGRWRAELLEQVGRGDVRGNLERCAMAYFEEAQGLLDALMLVFSRGHVPEHNPLLARLDNPVAQDTGALADYLRAELKLGRLRPLDAELTALTITGALTQYLQQGRMSPCSGWTPAANRDAGRDAGRFVRGLFDLLWPGMEPK